MKFYQKSFLFPLVLPSFAENLSKLCVLYSIYKSNPAIAPPTTTALQPLAIARCNAVILRPDASHPGANGERSTPRRLAL
jgi:hypothetical protein